MRFSAAVKFPCDKGEGLAGRGTGADKDVLSVEDAVAEEVIVVDVGGGGEIPDRLVEPEDDVEGFR